MSLCEPELAIEKSAGLKCRNIDRVVQIQVLVTDVMSSGVRACVCMRLFLPSGGKPPN